MKGGPIKAPVTNETMTPTKRDASGRVKHTGTCFLCVKKESTKKVCDECKKPVCAHHSKIITKCDHFGD